MLRGVVHLLMYRKRMDFLYYLISKFIAKSLMLLWCLLLLHVKITSLILLKGKLGISTCTPQYTGIYFAVTLVQRVFLKLYGPQSNVYCYVVSGSVVYLAWIFILFSKKGILHLPLLFRQLFSLSAFTHSHTTKQYCSLFTHFEWRIHGGFQGLHLTLTFWDKTQGYHDSLQGQRWTNKLSGLVLQQNTF